MSMSDNETYVLLYICVGIHAGNMYILLCVYFYESNIGGGFVLSQISPGLRLSSYLRCQNFNSASLFFGNFISLIQSPPVISVLLRTDVLSLLLNLYPVFLLLL